MYTKDIFLMLNPLGEVSLQENKRLALNDNHNCNRAEPQEKENLHRDMSYKL